jgi:hypothetical protein
MLRTLCFLLGVISAAALLAGITSTPALLSRPIEVGLLVLIDVALVMLNALPKGGS